MPQLYCSLKRSVAMTEKITSRKNEKIVHMKRLGSDRSYRESCGEYVCDGEKLLREAIDSGAEITDVLFSVPVPPALPEGTASYQVPQDLIDYASTQKSPQSVIFSCKMRPVLPELADFSGCLIIENIQDPGNVGTILRSAGAFGIPAVITVGACADPYNPKTVRSSMGAIFRQRIVNADCGRIAAWKENGLRVLGAALSDGSVDIASADICGAAIAVGNEGNGLSDELLALCDEKIIIPMSPHCESLNAGAAASIIMWEMMRRKP